MTTKIVNTAAYKFVLLKDLETLKTSFEAYFPSKDILGTILLSENEGINLMMAGAPEAIKEAQAYLHAVPGLEDMEFKDTFSQEKPFSKFKVKIKPEIVPMGRSDIRPGEFTGPTISAKELKQWLDEGKDFTLLDTRNDYEFDIGSFNTAVKLENLKHFREFGETVDQQLPEAAKEKPLVMFCTGGIRCEKASPLLIKKGFKEVYQLEGGIIKYFQEVGGAHYRGDCFIFDYRTAITSACEETGLTQCEVCQQFVTKEQQKKTNYVRGKPCLHCEGTEIALNFKKQRHAA